MDCFMKFVEVLEGVLGVNGTSSGTAKKTKIRTGTLIFWMVVNGLELLKYILYNRANILDKFLTSFPFLIAAITFYKSLVGSQRLASSSLTLKAAKSRLISAGIDIVPMKPTELFVFVSLSLFYIAGIVSSVVRELAKNFEVANVITLLSRMNYTMMQTTVTVRFLDMKISCKIIYRTLNKTLKDLWVKNDDVGEIETTHGSSRSTEPSGVSVPKERSKILSLLAKVERELLDTEKQINVHYYFLVLCRLVEVAWHTPNVLCALFFKQLFQEGFAYETLVVTTTFTLIAFIYISVDGAKDKQLSTMTLRQFHTINEDDLRTSVTRRLLSTMHSDDVDSYKIFDLDYGLILDVLDCAILVFTTMCYL